MKKRGGGLRIRLEWLRSVRSEPIILI